VNVSGDSIRLNKRLMAYSLAAMYAAAIGIDVVDAIIPGGSNFSVMPDLGGLGVVAVILAVGPRLPRCVLAAFGPIGVALLALALASVPGAGDGAVLYMWPVLWTAFFFGRPGAIWIVACIGLAHGMVLLSLAPADGYFDRWIDVMASVCLVAAIVEMLTRRNDQLQARLANEARTDKLTGLLNRRGFEERASVELAHARREARSVAVVSFDIDYFKHINDEWGHDAGDRVLARMGSVLSTRSRDVDVVARIGGEEFVVLMPETDAADADRFAARIRLALAAPDRSGIPAVRVSAGVAAAAGPSDLEALLQHADSALYAAKRAGRDRTVIAETERVPIASGLQASGTP